jgi:D-serine deaminase-like pyridoxal phosphate-dependent protein
VVLRQSLATAEIDTPALLLDAAALEQNVTRMAAFAQEAGVALRPHSKTHKCPQIARLQLAAGAIGITCQKLGEAEVMAAAGIDHLLIANEIVGPLKIQRLVNLARRTDLMVAVDDPQNVADLSAAASAAQATVGILVEVDTGMGRCGVPPGDSALKLAEVVLRSPGLQFRGLMGYEGHTVMIMDADERRKKATVALQQLTETADLLRASGIAVPIVSSSGTGTYNIGGGFAGVTEMQTGSYATMDGRYQQVGVPFSCALTVLATVISTPRAGVAIADAGMKAVSTEFGLPQVVGIPGATVLGLSEEHTKIALSDGAHLRPGDRIELLPMHGCTTINLHDRYYVLRSGTVEDIWPVAARGKCQ